MVVALSFAVPVTAYAAWYHAEHGVWALTEAGGRALYMRTTGFVDCSAFTMPAYERAAVPGGAARVAPGPHRLRLARPLTPRTTSCCHPV